MRDGRGLFVQYLLVVGAALATLAIAEDVTHDVKLTIDRVVIHTASAVVFSSGQLEVDEGPLLILLRNLSVSGMNQSLEEKSLQVNLKGGGALVERIVWDDVSLLAKDELEAMADEVEIAKSNLTRVKEKMELAQSHMATLQKFGSNLVSPSPDLVQKGETIVKILQGAHEAQLELDESIHSMKKQHSHLQNHLRDLQANLRRSSHLERVAKVYISVERSALITLNLQQIAASVTWRPHYEIHVDSTSGMVAIAYHALVRQQTRQHWTNVSLELCTGAPSTDRRLPALAPWFITSTGAASRAAYSKMVHSSAGVAYSKKSRRPIPKSSGVASNDDDDYGDLDQDSFGRDEQEEEQEDKSFAQSGVISSGASDVFVLPKRQTIPSSHEIRVHIAALNLKANLTYTAVPKRSTKVYVQASITNDSPFTVLPGSSLVFVDGSFAGSSRVSLIPINGHAFLDAGIDNSLAVAKKVVSVETKQGDWIKRTLEGLAQTKHFHYEVLLKNMRPFGVMMRVKEQVPLPQSEDLTVLLKTANPAHEFFEVTADGLNSPAEKRRVLHVDVNATLEEGGMITWERYVPPDSTLKIPLSFVINMKDASREIRHSMHRDATDFFEL